MPSDKITVPNLLSASRLVMAPAIYYFIQEGEWIYCTILLWLAIGTDLADGYLARKYHISTNFGGLLDHSSDALFVSCALFSLAKIGVLSIWLPILIPLAFLQYVFDSKALAGFPLRASFLGRHNGILYFVMAGLPIMQAALDLELFSDRSIVIIAYLLIASTLISMTDRLVGLIEKLFIRFR